MNAALHLGNSVLKWSLGLLITAGAFSTAAAEDNVLFTSDGPGTNAKFKNVLTVSDDEGGKIRFERTHTIVAQDKRRMSYAFRTPSNVCELIPGETFTFGLKASQGKLQDQAPFYLSDLAEYCGGAFDP